MKFKKLLVLPMLIGLIFCLTGCSFSIENLKFWEKDTKTTTTEEHKDHESTALDESFLTADLKDFQIHFFNLGNDKAGDCTYIKAGKCDILIDGGSATSSWENINSYLLSNVEDNQLEFVIATHGDSDHISNFPKIFKNYSVNTIIDFQYTTKTTTTYQNYLMARDELVEKGTTHYFASQCFYESDGATKKYQLSAYVTMEILYNKYYFEKSSDENNHSVVTLFTYDNGIDTPKYFFFSGDAEKEAEESIASYYDGSTPSKTLPKVDFFKAGHHGSKTSSNDCLLDIIQPKMCVVTCCCGTDEYTEVIKNQFPTQDFIDRISKWTDAVYIPLIFDTEEKLVNTIENGKKKVSYLAENEEYFKTSGYKEMNGNIIVSINTDNGEVSLYCSNNYTKLKDTSWFNEQITLNGKTIPRRNKPTNWQ